MKAHTVTLIHRIGTKTNSSQDDPGAGSSKLFNLRNPFTLLQITEDTKELLFIELYLLIFTVLETKIDKISNIHYSFK